MQKTFCCCRFVFNHYLAQRIDAYKNEQKSISRFEQDKEMTQLKNELVWLKEVDATALQSSIQNLDAAHQNFFRRVKQGEKPGFPRFKSKHDNKKPYKGKAAGKNIQVFEGKIKLPKLGHVECRTSKKVEGGILSATVSQNPSGKYFASVCCTDVEILQHESANAKVGLDMGLRDFAVTSDSDEFENHKRLAKSRKKLARLQRRLSRKAKGSQNRSKARVKVARLHEKISNQRSDMLHKLPAELVKRYGVICIEDLQVKNMVKNHKLAKSINDVAWSEFVRQLQYKCEWQRKALVKVDKFYPSSQLCGECGYKNAEAKDLSVRKWTCPQCSANHGRDVNAAQNILKEGLRMLSA
jgi:putative transposase